MRIFYFIVVFTLTACNNQQQKVPVKNADTATVSAKITREQDTLKSPDSLPAFKTYANERFKDVTVEKSGDHQFVVQGKAQIFEANFGWVIEDGHNELQKGNQMTDAGAPAWGNFKFTIDVQKERENSTLHLILFEPSPKDGSRQYELPVPLY